MIHKTAFLFNTNFPEDGSHVADARQKNKLSFENSTYFLKKYIEFLIYKVRLKND